MATSALHATERHCRTAPRERTLMSQMVHVVSMLDVPMMLVSAVFQSNDVSGAQYSLVLFCACAAPEESPVTLLHQRRDATVPQ